MMLWKVLPSMQIECCDDGPWSNGSKSGYHLALIALYWVSTSENFGYLIISVDSYFMVSWWPLSVSVDVWTSSILIRMFGFWVQWLNWCTPFHGCSSCEDDGGRYPCPRIPKHRHRHLRVIHRLQRKLATVTLGSGLGSSSWYTRILSDEDDEGFWQWCEGNSRDCILSSTYSLLFPIVDPLNTILYKPVREVSIEVPQY